MHELTWVQLVVADTGGSNVSAWALFFEASGVVLLVLLLLIAASIGTWFIVGYKWLALRRANQQSRRFHDVFWQSKRLDSIYQQAEALPHSPVSKVFQAGYVELRKLKGREGEETMSQQLGGIENVERALRRAMSAEINQMERLMPFLATVGATAPFVGLFGTVWGIMLAFMEIAAMGQAGIDVVSGPIAEALIATAIGLVAAIPAVIAFNFFNARIRGLAVEMENFSSDFLNIVKRHFFK
ncbi:MAG: protein TolQ [Deltaproteobacteria bacterium]|nr:MAG: protein TolQ [Deltaproteobacteria bacterium]